MRQVIDLKCQNIEVVSDIAGEGPLRGQRGGWCALVYGAVTGTCRASQLQKKREAIKEAGAVLQVVLHHFAPCTVLHFIPLRC